MGPARRRDDGQERRTARRGRCRQHDLARDGSPLTPVIRPARDADATAISSLVTQLGYPASADAIPSRLAGIAADSHSIALVAEIADTVVGVVTGHIIHSIHVDQSVAQLTTIVVDEAHRGSGVGSMLVERIEQWAKENGAARISLTSGAQRHDTHKFYDNRGYERTGIRFAKKFSAD